MAEIDLIKISELPATSTIGDADELAVVQGGATKKVPYSVLKAGAEVTPDTTLSEAGVPADAAAVGAALALKANQAAVTQALAAKADKTEVAGISGDIAELASVVETKADQTALNQKADKTTTDALRQDLTTLNGIVNQKADKTELNTQIGNVTAELATKADTDTVNAALALKADKTELTAGLASKQNVLTFDSTPTEGSTNPVTSGGVWEAVQTDKTLAVEDKAADAKITGDAITGLKNEISYVNDGNINPAFNASENVYVLATDGKLSPYNGWSATDFIYCENLESIYVNAPTLSAYNAFYSDENEESFISAFSVTTDTSVLVPDGAKYFRLSNSSNALKNSVVYGYIKNKTIEIIKTVDGITEQVENLNDAVFETLTTDNYIDNTEKFWKSGRWDNPSLSYVIHSEEIKLDGLGIIYFGGYCYGTPISDSPAIVIRIFDADRNLLYSTSPKVISSVWSLSSGNLSAYSDAKYIVVDITTNSVSALVTPANFVNNYRLYVGKTNLASADEYYNKYVYVSRIPTNTILPWYWQNSMKAKIARLRELDGVVGSHGFSFVFITDVHWQNNYKKSPMLIQHILENTSVDTVICGGDILTRNDSISDAMAVIDAWGEKTRNLGTINVFGNHDNNSNGGNAESLWIGYDRWYGALLRPIENKVVWSDDKKYFYIDNPAQKVRMIFLNTGYDQGGGLDNTQAGWMQQLLYNLANGWKAIVFTHLFFAPATVASGVTELSILGSGTLARNVIDGQYANMTAHGAEFICVVTGHVHRDYSIVTDAGYPVIGTTCDANGLQASLYDPVNTTRTDGTTTEQAFDVYHIDTENRKIYITRIGAGSDREFTY